MEKIILDFDNSLGLVKKDVDDAIALAFLLKSKKFEIIAVSTTFGNASIEDVNKVTLEMFKELNINIPILLGNEKAGQKIAQLVANDKNNISILSIGSLHNIANAIDYDPNFPANIKKFIAMGGITEDLIINGKILKELNFSCSYHDSYKVLTSINNPIIITANNCLNFGLKTSEITDIFNQDKKLAAYFKEKSSLWFNYHLSSYKINYIILWDLIAALYCYDSNKFNSKNLTVKISLDKIKYGYLALNNHDYNTIITFPILKDIDEYKNIVKNVWKNKLN